MYQTIYMGLYVWDLGGDPYSYSQLANNFQNISDHDHANGRGKQVPSGGIENGAVVESKIASDAVTGVKIASNSIEARHIKDNSVENRHLVDNSVGTVEIQNESITTSKIHTLARIPLGTVVSWYRANSSIPIPEGWAVADGTAWSATPNSMGLSSGFMPDLRNKFILGSALGGTGTGTGTPPPELSTGGSHTVNLSHSHATPIHSHVVPDHAHGIPYQSDNHVHRFWSEHTDGSPFLTELHQRQTAVPSGFGSRQASYVHELNQGSDGDPPIPMGPPEYLPTGGRVDVRHNHGGATAGSGNIATTPSDGGATGSSLSTVDIRPRFIGLLYIMKVRA